MYVPYLCHESFDILCWKMLSMNCLINLYRINLIIFVRSVVNNFPFSTFYFFLFDFVDTFVFLQPKNSSSRSRRMKSNSFCFCSRFSY